MISNTCFIAAKIQKRKIKSKVPKDDLSKYFPFSAGTVNTWTRVPPKTQTSLQLILVRVSLWQKRSWIFSYHFTCATGGREDGSDGSLLHNGGAPALSVRNRDSGLGFHFSVEQQEASGQLLTGSSRRRNEKGSWRFILLCWVTI